MIKILLGFILDILGFILFILVALYYIPAESQKINNQKYSVCNVNGCEKSHYYKLIKNGKCVTYDAGLLCGDFHIRNNF